MALANIDPIIELIRHAPTPAEAKTALVANPWQLGNVAAMLERAGDDAAGSIGLIEDGDLIAIDIPNRGIQLQVSDAELAARREAQEARGDKAWTPKNRERQVVFRKCGNIKHQAGFVRGNQLTIINPAMGNHLLNRRL